MTAVGTKLTAFLRDYKQRPFSWQDHYCAILAYQWYVFLCQEECEWVLPQASSRTELLRWLASRGLTIELAVSRAPRLQQIHPSQSLTGDIILCQPEDTDFKALGIRNGMRGVFLSESGSLLNAPVAFNSAWRVLT